MSPRFGLVDAKGPETIDQFGRQGLWSQPLALGADEHLVPCRSEKAVAQDQHVEIDRDRALAEAGEIGRHPQLIVESRRVHEVGFQVNPRQPDPESFEDLAVGHAGGAEELGFGDLEEPNVGSVEYDASVVYIGPTNVLVDDERMSGHFEQNSRRGAT